MAAVMNMQAPHRKPVPTRAPYSQAQQVTAQYGGPASNAYPSNGSSATPSLRNASLSYNTMQQQQQQQYPQQSRRTLSNATSSTSSTSTNTGAPRAPPSNYSSSIRRSTSSRSTSTTSPTSYVALMRKQKATVWCDRAQHEDPRILAAQRQAKMRAATEVAGGAHRAPQSSRTNTGTGMVGGVRSKIRHHGAPKASTYHAANLSGAGVPMRLSASEVDEGDSDEEPRYHQRNGSGRSSLGSGHRNQSLLASNSRGHMNGSTPPSGHSPPEGMGDLAEEETPTPNQHGGRSDDYFAQAGGQGGSGSSGETEARFGGIGGLPVQRARAESERKTSEELRRRGSVDDRTMTMSAGRLFVANPDLSD